MATMDKELLWMSRTTRLLDEIESFDSKKKKRSLDWLSSKIEDMQEEKTQRECIDLQSMPDCDDSCENASFQ